MKKSLLFVVFTMAVSLFTLRDADAKFFFRPIFGFTVPLTGGDSSYAVGGAIGYSLFDTFALESSYTRLIPIDGPGTTHLIQFTGTYSFFLPAITPFLRGGGGFYKYEIAGVDTDFEAMIEIGGGIVFTFIPVIDLGVGLSYLILLDGKDLIYPNFYAGISF